MDVLLTAAWIIFLLMAAAHPEIPSKGKQQRILDAQASDEEFGMPRFAEPIPNITVTIGRDALLACVVENLKSFKVAWVRVDTQTILSIHHNVITQNERVSLTYNDHRSWYLHITNVTESDRGWYMCQVNTDPMRSRKGYLQVVVPPLIIESLTSADMVVREGANVTLMCKARGFPEPYVMWRREDGAEMAIGGEYVNVVDGEILHITKVSRLHMAAYLCVASNGVPPSVSKRVNLRVQFPPMLSIPNQLEGAYVGQDVTLECHTEAYPASINYWTTERGDMIISDTSRAGDKYETTSSVSGYSKFMKLKIRAVGSNDFGTYRCVAKNSLGETDGNIKLDEMPAPTTAIISETAMLNRSLDGKRLNRNKFDLNALPDYGVEEWRDGTGSIGGVIGVGLPGGDNNQPPVRNPPGAFHNAAASSLAQRNPLSCIIHGIKMQSVGIFKHLSSYLTLAGWWEQQHQQQQASRRMTRATTTTAIEKVATAAVVIIKLATKHVEQQRNVIVMQGVPIIMATITAQTPTTTTTQKTMYGDNGNSDSNKNALGIANLTATIVSKNESNNNNMYCHNNNNSNNSESDNKSCFDRDNNTKTNNIHLISAIHTSSRTSAHMHTNIKTPTLAKTTTTFRTHPSAILSHMHQMLRYILAYCDSSSPSSSNNIPHHQHHRHHKYNSSWHTYLYRVTTKMYTLIFILLFLLLLFFLWLANLLLLYVVANFNNIYSRRKLQNNHNQRRALRTTQTIKPSKTQATNKTTATTTTTTECCIFSTIAPR